MKKLFISFFVFASFLYSDTGKSGWLVLRKLEPLKPYSLVTSAKVKGELSGVYYNPAIASTVRSGEIFFTGEQGYMETSSLNFLLGFPLNSESGVVGGISFFDGGNMDLYWMEGSTLKKQTVSAETDFMGMFSYGRYFSEKFSGGATFKFATSEIAEYKKANCFALDFGTLVKMSKNSNFSAALKNLGTSGKFEEKESPLPLIFSAGLMFEVPFQNSFLDFGVSGDYNMEDEEFYPDFGAGANFGMFSINLGYRVNVEEGALSFGFGIVQGNIDFGYKYKSADYLDARHIFGIGLKFGEAQSSEKKTKKHKTEIFTEKEKKEMMKEYFNRATKLYNQGKYKEAIREWENVLDLGPNHELSKIKIEKAKQMLEEQTP